MTEHTAKIVRLVEEVGVRRKSMRRLLRLKTSSRDSSLMMEVIENENKIREMDQVNLLQLVDIPGRT